MLHETVRVQPKMPTMLRPADQLDAARQATGQSDVGRDPVCQGPGTGEDFVGDGIHFTVPGTPVGKGRPRFARRGNFVTTFTPEKTASYENLVKLLATQAMRGRPLIEGAVVAVIELVVAVPASWSQKKQAAALAGSVYPTSKPDLDNVIKGICDALNTVVWRDDKQVCALRVIKRYGQTPRAIVSVCAIE